VSCGAARHLPPQPTIGVIVPHAAPLARLGQRRHACPSAGLALGNSRERG